MNLLEIGTEAFRILVHRWYQAALISKVMFLWTGDAQASQLLS